MLLVLLSASSCNPEKRIVSKLSKIKYKSPVAVAEFCSDMFPNVDSTNTEYVYVAGPVLHDTIIWEDISTVRDTIVIKRNNTVLSVRVDTVHHNRYVRTVDKAGISACQSKLTEHKEVIASMKKEKGLLWKVIIVLSLYTILRWLFKALKSNVINKFM